MTQQPSIGRVVHYTSRGSADGRFDPLPRAAIITSVHWSDNLEGETWDGRIPTERPGTGQASVSAVVQLDDRRTGHAASDADGLPEPQKIQGWAGSADTSRAVGSSPPSP